MAYDLVCCCSATSMPSPQDVLASGFEGSSIISSPIYPDLIQYEDHSTAGQQHRKQSVDSTTEKDLWDGGSPDVGTGTCWGPPLRPAPLVRYTDAGSDTGVISYSLSDTSIAITKVRESSTSKRRREQNRAAQRAFRERKDRYRKDLEDQLDHMRANYKDLADAYSRQTHKVNELRDHIRRLALGLGCMYHYGAYGFDETSDVVDTTGCNDTGLCLPQSSLPHPHHDHEDESQHCQVHETSRP